MSTPKSPVLRRVDAERRHRVVVVGGGFAGLQAVRALRRAPVEVTLVDRRNFHLFQPLLYQVATGALTAAEIASPLRALLKRQRNATVVLGEVSGFDLRRRRVLLAGRAIGYDTLVVAAGAAHASFGHDEWRRSAPGLKSLEDAVEIRRRILTAFESAELEADPARRRALLTFVVVGGGPARAARALERLGVTALVDHAVVDVRPDAVGLRRDDGATERISTRTVVWAAGVRASGLAGALAGAAGAPLDQAGRVAVGPDLTLAGHPHVLALGDMVSVHDADGHALALPGVAPVAMQQGRYAAKAIRTRLKGREPSAFRYLDITPSIAAASEHEQVWKRLSAVAPVDHYQRRTRRALPVVILRPSAAGAPLRDRPRAGLRRLALAS